MPKKYSRLSKRNINQLIQYFDADLSATQAARLSNQNHNTVNDWFTTFRVWIAEHQELVVARTSGAFVLDESYFGGVKREVSVRPTAC